MIPISGCLLEIFTANSNFLTAVCLARLYLAGDCWDRPSSLVLIWLKVFSSCKGKILLPREVVESPSLKVFKKRVDISQQCVLAAQKANCALG